MYICTACKAEYSKWQGQCSACQKWNTIEESTTVQTGSKKKSHRKLKTISLQKTTSSKRLQIGIEEFDRVLGGGFVSGEVLLLSGAPGIGKSTLLLQSASSFSKKNKLSVLYVAGEESSAQISTRAERVDAVHTGIQILEERDVDAIINFITSSNEFSLIIIDSIQTMISSDISASAGSVSQVTQSADKLTTLAKRLGIPMIIVGHITKEGSVAGPKILEHIVDAVVSFEGDKFHQYRLLRSQKNRFGSIDEVGVFEMKSSGLEEVKNPSDTFISERHLSAGSAVTVCIEGTRPMLFEVQALVTKSYFSNPRRTASGIDYNRLLLLCAVLEKKAGIKLGEYDVYVNISGGARIGEPAVDLAVCFAIASSFKNKSLGKNTAVFGEVGLLGEVKKVSYMDQRIKEAKKLGFSDILSPSNIIDLKSGLINFL